VCGPPASSTPHGTGDVARSLVKKAHRGDDVSGLRPLRTTLIERYVASDGGVLVP